MPNDNPIPESYRRKALYAALYHHDAVQSYSGGESDGDPVRVQVYPPGHPKHSKAKGGPPTPETALKYVKRVAGALGFSYSTEGRFRAKLTPDTEHALAGLKGEYSDVQGARP